MVKTRRSGFYYGVAKGPLPCPDGYLLLADPSSRLRLISPDNREWLPEFNAQNELVRAYLFKADGSIDERCQLHFKQRLGPGSLFEALLPEAWELY